MEVIFLLALLLMATFLAFRKRSPQESNEISKPEIASRTPSPENPVVQSQEKQPLKFDAKSARHIETTKILAGSAWVTDGDTIKIKNTQIRLFGIDAPELNHPYGKKAKWALHKLCKGHTVRAEITDEDQYGRTVAKCFLSDGRDLSAEMVKLGLAIDWPKFSGGKYKSLEASDARKRLFLADARQKGRMHVWDTFEARQAKQ